jgi:hypothetical protein
MRRRRFNLGNVTLLTLLCGMEPATDAQALTAILPLPANDNFLD